MGAVLGLHIMNYSAHLRHRLLRLPILYRIAIGNGVIIIFGAVAGTLVTRHLARQAADLPLILVFAAFGILISVVINYWIVKSALRPLYDLRQLVDRIQAGQARKETFLLDDTDPDIEKLAAALHSLVQRLEDRSVKLRALSERAINAQEEERKRIARELHDETAQAMSMLVINLERLEQSMPPEASELQSKLNAARLLATQMVKDLRKIISDLRPSILDDLGLVPAIRSYARSNLETKGIQVDFDMPDAPLSLPVRLETTLFRATQEAINNIRQHAETESAHISLHHNGDRICLWIADRGRGFDVAQTSSEAVELHRLGLLGMQERAELVGGDVYVDSALGKGTRLRICVPLDTR